MASSSTFTPQFLFQKETTDNDRMSDKLPSNDAQHARSNSSGARPKRSPLWISVPRVNFQQSPTNLSAMTTPTPNRGRSKKNASDNDTPTTNTTAATPMTRSRMTAVELMNTVEDAETQERVFESRFQRDAPCANDSEEEPDDPSDEEDSGSDEEAPCDHFAALRELQRDEMELAEAQRAAEILSSDYVESPDAFDTEEVAVEGAPPGWTIPVPEEYVERNRSKKKNEPRWENVDNPGGWSKFCFQPKYEALGKGKGFKYLYHATPCGATPVPKINGRRAVGGWEFHYAGWEPEEPTNFRSGANSTDPFPKERKGQLDVKVLKKLGITKESMLQPDGAPDALKFLQLIFPICDTSRNGITDDPRLPFYSSVSHWSNLYAVGELKLGMGYGHDYKMITLDELVKWDGILMKDGVLGGSNGAMLRRWDTRVDNAMFDAAISKAMTKTRYLEIKRCIKLCNNKECPKRGEPNYEPAYKFDYIYKTICHNVNAITKRACLDLSADESTWPYQGWGEPGSGLVKKKLKKPGAPSGGQVTLVSDCDRLRPRAYIHRHKLHKRPKGVTSEGTNEVRLLWARIKPMVAGIEDDDDDSDEENVNPLLPSKSIIFTEKPHITFDNYFSGDNTLAYVAKEGFGCTMTVSRNCLPSGIPKKYLHHGQPPNDLRNRHSRFTNPIFAVKKAGKSFIQLCSFQSTSSCNIASVNAINGCHLFSRSKERGRGINKRHWAIEMNESRQLYLGTYGKIDNVDHYATNTHMEIRYGRHSHRFSMSY